MMVAWARLQPLAYDRSLRESAYKQSYLISLRFLLYLVDAARFKIHAPMLTADVSLELEN